MSFKTLIEMFEYNVNRYGKKPFIRSRLINEKGDLFDEKHSWTEIRDQSKRIALVLSKIGERSGKHIAILAENSYRWIVADLGIMYLGAISLDLYPNDTNLNIASSLKTCDVNTIFVGNTKLLNKITSLIVDYSLPIRNIIITDFKVSKVENNSNIIKIYTWDQILIQEANAALYNKSDYIIEADLPTTTLLNSGAENSCKLIPLSHKNIISNIESFAKDLKYKPGMNILSCDSLADVFNKNFAYYSAIYAGASLYFPFDPLNFQYDLAYKTIHVASISPKLLAELEESVNAQLEKDSFNKFLLNIPFLSLIAQSSLKKSHGKHLKFMICSGSYLPAYLNQNMNNYGFKLLQSYGTTESSGPISICSSSAGNSGNVGKVAKCFEWKINNNNENELEISGPPLCSGYINSPELESESFYLTESNRWFKTGDILSQGTNQTLNYSGKSCELVLNSQEQKISLSRPERLLRDVEYIEDALIIGEDKPFVSALITIRDERFRRLFKKLDKYSVRQQCEKLIDKINKSLAEPEKIRKFSILDQSLRTSKSELSPNKKIRRKVIESRFQDLINSFYD